MNDVVQLAARGCDRQAKVMPGATHVLSSFLLPSCLIHSKIIVGEVASTPEEVRMYASCTLLAASMASEQPDQLGAARSHGAIEACIDWLMDNEFIHIQKEGEGEESFRCCRCVSHSLHMNMWTCEPALLLQGRSTVLRIWVLPHCRHLCHLQKRWGFSLTCKEQ